MSANGVLFEELAMIRTLNERIARGDSPYGQQQPVVLPVIKPRYPLPLDPDLYFNRIDNATLVERGYADAWPYLGALPAGGVVLLPSRTMHLRAWPVAAPRPATSTGSGHLGLRAWLRLRRGGHIGNTGLLGQLRARYLFTRLLTR